jgi:NAD dependent epimerase/dehydratase
MSKRRTMCGKGKLRMNLANKTVLITGAGGFIGSHLTERLIETGARIRAFVHYNALGRWGWLDGLSIGDNVEVITGDVCDRDSVRGAMKGCDLVYHLAALIAIPYSYSAPGSYLRTNIEGTLNVLQVARDLDVERVVHTSTSEVYGTARYVPIDEGHPLQGQSPYSASKIAADKMAESFYRSFGLPVVTVRPFNTFGPRQSARAVIPTIISQSLMGNTIKLGNLNPTRDLNYVANTVEGFLLASVSPDLDGQTINLGSGREISIGDLVQLIARLLGKKSIEITNEHQRMRPDKSEVERLLSDNTLARKLLGWNPSIGLEEGLTRTIEWIRQNMERYRPNVYTV